MNLSSKQLNEDKQLQKIKERFKNVGKKDSKVFSDIFSKKFIDSQNFTADKKMQEQDQLINTIYKISNEENLTSDFKLKKILNLIRDSDIKYY